MLQMGSVAWLPEYEPGRPTIGPKRRVVVLRRGAGGLADYREDWGAEGWRRVRFTSTDRTGFITPAQMAALTSLYEGGANFALVTNLLKPHGGTADTYSAFFDPDTEPVFQPATPDGTLYFFDVVLLVN